MDARVHLRSTKALLGHPRSVRNFDSCRDNDLFGQHITVDARPLFPCHACHFQHDWCTSKPTSALCRCSHCPAFLFHSFLLQRRGFFEWGTIFFWPPIPTQIPTQIPIMHTLTPALIIVLTVAGALRMANRITLSSIIAFSTIPWAAFWLNIAVVDLPYGRTNEMLISLTGIVLVAAFVFLQQKFEIIIRPRQTEPEQSDHPFSGRTDLSHTQSIITVTGLPSQGLKASPPD